MQSCNRPKHNLSIGRVTEHQLSPAFARKSARKGGSSVRFRVHFRAMDLIEPLPSPKGKILEFKRTVVASGGWNLGSGLAFDIVGDEGGEEIAEGFDVLMDACCFE